MADSEPQNHEKPQLSPPAAAPPQDCYSILSKVIDDVSSDHAMLRKLVYALAWRNLRPEAIVAEPIAEAQTQAKSIVELERALVLERAIERLEAEAAGQPPREIAKSEPPEIAEPVQYEEALVAAESYAEPEPQQTVSQSSPAPDSNAAPAYAFCPAELVDWTPATGEPQNDESAVVDPPIESVRQADASFEPPHSGNAIVLAPDQRVWPERKDLVTVERIPAWLDPSVRISLDTVEYAPVRRPFYARSHLTSFFQLIAASAIGVILYVGISGWVYLGRHSGQAPGAAPPPQTAPVASAEQAVAAQAQAPAVRLPPEPQPILPFPLPRTYGVYAGAAGQLFELAALPIKVPDPRVLVSAEITKPSHITTPGEDIAFIVFRRDLVNSAPQTATVRVVARVQRATKFVDGKPTIVPVEGVWRVRSKAYEFKVSPLEGRNEMIVIQPNPGFVFPPGRYALVLNGFGYDFTVAGPVTAPEQCLEQVEVVNGAVLAECPKT